MSTFIYHYAACIPDVQNTIMTRSFDTGEVWREGSSSREELSERPRVTLIEDLGDISVDVS